MSLSHRDLIVFLLSVCILLADVTENSELQNDEEDLGLRQRLKPRRVSKRDSEHLKSPWLNADWNAMGRKRIETTKSHLERSRNTKPARNVILFVGDGMGISTISAGRILKAQKRNLNGEDIYLAWENFPHAGLARTYTVDRVTSDSAGTATAYLSGIKANMGTIGVNEHVKIRNCSNIDGNKVDSILHKSIAAGKWTGVVTTTRITHASPAGCYASSAFRDWEASVPSDLPSNRNCHDIAHQLIHSERNKNIRVMFGGGTLNFLPNSTTDEASKKIGLRVDGRNLLEEWLSMKSNESKKASLLKNKADFDSFNPQTAEYVLGLFGASHMNYEVDRNSTLEPSLAELTEKSIRMLNRSRQGFFLFVEGGRIDHAHHENSAYKALHDLLAMEKAVQTAMDLTTPEETLILVTADHSHVFTMGGYAKFQESIFGFADSNEEAPLDKKPYTQLMYSNGPGYSYHRVTNGSLQGLRKNLSASEVLDRNFVQDSTVWLASETHGGEDVAVYASGPWAHLFQGIEEQSYVAHVMMYASCVGQYTGEEHCSTSRSSHVNSIINKLSVLILMISFLFIS